MRTFFVGLTCYYQIRQAFLPGETDPETALKISYDLAMRWTKGRHAFFVVSHAVRRLSDRICLENGLSIITNPKRHSKGKFKHYGEWLGGHKPPTFQEKLKAQIDICLATKPPDMDTFLQAMVAAGYEIKQGLGSTISFRADGQERFTRLRASTLGKSYGQKDIQAEIEDRTAQGQPDCGYSSPYESRKRPSL